MARDNELRTRLTATDDASKVIDQVADKAEELEDTEIELDVSADTGTAERDIEGLLSKVDRLAGTDAANLLLTSNAAEITREITDLVTEVDRLDATDPEVQIKVDQIRQLEGDLETISAKAKEINGTPINLSTGPARQGLDDLGRSADSSKSVLANMVGNATQDLGALGGVAGSAGVAIGQMGEYMADAAAGGERFGSIAKNFLAVAGPIAALGVGVQLVTQAWGNYQRSQELAAKKTADATDALAEQLGIIDELTGALDPAASAADAFAAAMAPEDLAKSARSLGALGLTVEDLGQALMDIEGDSRAAMAALAVGAGVPDDMAEALARAVDQTESWGDAVARLRADEGWSQSQVDQFAAVGKALEELNDQQQNYDAETIAQGFLDQAAGASQASAALVEQATAAAKAKDANASAVDVLDEYVRRSSDAATATELTREQVLEFAAALGQAGDEARQVETDELKAKIEAAGQAMIDAALKINDAETALRDLNSTFSQMSIRDDSLSSLFDLGNAPLDAAGEVRDVAIAIGELSAAAAGISGDAIRLGAIDADPLLDSIDALRPEIQAKVTEAFSAGGPEAATAMANSYIDQVTAELGGKLTREDVARLLGLESIEATVAVALEMSAVETARRQLEILTGIGGETPYTASIALALDAGAITGEQAQAMIQAKLVDAGVTIPGELAVDTALAEDTVEGFTSGDYSTTVDLEGNAAPAERVADDYTSERRTTTPVDINASSVLALGIMLAFLTARRTTTVDILANSLPALLSIANVIQPRTATINVQAPNAAAVDRQLNNIARDRSSTINITTRQTTVMQRVDGG